MDLVSVAEMFKQFGPIGLTIIMMGGGLVYLTRWLREDRKQSDANHTTIRGEFLSELKEQRADNTTALKEITADFRETISEQGKRIDGLSEKVEAIDGHVQELRIKR